MDKTGNVAGIMWDRVEDMNQVQGLCYKVADPNLFRAMRIYEAAEKAKDELLKALSTEDGVDRQGEAIQVSSQLKKAAEDLDELAGVPDSKIGLMAATVRGWNKEVVKKGIGFDVS